MTKFLRFAVVHSLRDMGRSRSRTIFALVCVATGVAAVVALRSLAFMIGDELTTNLAQMNRGDIRLYASVGVPELVQLSTQGDPVFNQQALDLMRDWAESEDVGMTPGRMGMFAQITPVLEGQPETSQAAQVMFVEPEHYPFYDSITLSDPAGVTLDQLFAQTPSGAGTADDPRAVVISGHLARRANLNLHVGSTLRVGASETLYVVRGIAPTTSETLLTNPSAAFLGDYLYLPFSDLAQVGEAVLPDQVFFKVPVGRDIKAEEKSLIKYLQSHVKAETNFDKELNRVTVPELEKQNSETAGVIDDMILVMGLSSLLIGGIGIINTMLVVVSRRTLEIAVLKTLGLKAYRVTALFLVEALLMGLLGSLLGVVVGIGLSYLIRGVGEEAFAIGLTWHLYPEAMFSGLFLGMVITGLFGFLPTLVAGQVRPAVVLRPNEAQMPAAGLLQVLVTLVVMIAVLGLLVSSIVEGAIHYGPVIMIAGGGTLVGLFAGVIVANTRLGRPMPENYRFRLARRYERLENRLTGAAGVLRWPGAPPDRGERGRLAITRGLRTLRQAVLLYGALAVGAALASALVLILSEVWLPFGIGHGAKPANDVYHAWKRGDADWVGFWILLTLGFGLLIRRRARTFGGMIGLSSLGITFGGAGGLALGYALEGALGATGFWNFLADMSTGVVLVEGALALLGVVFIGYWLLVWSVSKMPNMLLMAVVSVTVLGIIVGLAAGVALLGRGALVVLIVVAVLAWLGLRFQVWRHLPQTVYASPLPSRRADDRSEIARLTARGTSAALLGAAVFAASILLNDALGAASRLGAYLVGLLIVVGLWRYLRRGYQMDGRLVLREMAGRRQRVASTLLGLSVGIAGLSMVALTTSAVSRMLEVQLGENIEGNLLIGDPTSKHGEEVLNVLRHAEGVESFSQVTTYAAVLAKINGKTVEVHRHPSEDEQSSPAENSSFEPQENGISLALTARVSLDDLPDYRMASGRNFEPEDAGQHLILVRESFFTEEYGIGTDDRLMLVFENKPGKKDDVLLQFRVIGVISRQSKQTGLEEYGNFWIMPPGVLPDTVTPAGIATIAKIDETNGIYMDQVMIALANVPGVIAIQVSAITQLIQNLLDQLKSIPTLVAWLALVAGTAIIANTVALATQERRRQIGVMKAVGLKGRRVLGMLMIENGLIGLIAGLIGVFVGFLVTVILVLATPNAGALKDAIEFSTMGWLILMSIGVAIGAAILSAWSAAAEKPMNVLRYE